MIKTLFSLFLLISTGTAAGAPPEPPKLTPEAEAKLPAQAADLEKQVSASPKNYDLYMNLGRIYMDLNRADDAQKTMEKAAAVNPKKDAAYFMLGLIYEKKGLKDKAISSWKKCLETASEERIKSIAAKHIAVLSVKSES